MIIIAIIKKKNSKSLIIKILRFLLPVIIYPLYFPIMTMLLSVFSCEEDKHNTYISSITCWDTLHIFFCTISGILSILYYVLSLIFVNLLFGIDLYEKNQPFYKFTSYPDLVALNMKTLLIILTIFLKNNDISHFKQWTTIVIYLIFSFFCFYQYYYFKPYLHNTIQFCYIITYFIVFWSFFVLGIAMIFHNTSFNGGLPLLLIGIPLIVIMFGFNRNETLHNSILFDHKGASENKLLHHLFSLLYLSERVKDDREAFISIKGYITSYEDNCPFKNCPLKKLITITNNMFDVDSFTEQLTQFYQHVEILCLNIIEQNPTFIWIKIFYSYFLIKKLKKKQLALTQIKNCYHNELSYEKEYLLYSLKTFINDGSSSEDDSSSKSNVLSHLQFTKELQNLKQTIKEVNLSYIDFWGTLLISNSDNKENLDKLNHIGKKITRGKDKIESIFTSLQKAKNNDKEVLTYYSDYLLNVLNDRALSLQYKKVIYHIEAKDIFYTSSSSNEFSNDNLTLNLNAISTTDNNLFIVISANEESPGIITNISLSICSMLGYPKKELLGKRMDILLPKIIVKLHNTILHDKALEIKKTLISKGAIEYHNKEIESYGITKSKYLIPLSFKTGIVYNKNNEFSFLVKLYNNSSHSSTNQLTFSSYDCDVMTSTDFIIQHFTPNGYSLLGLESECVNGNTEITEYIKEFHEEFLKNMLETEEKNHKQIIAIKQKIQKTKFSNESMMITWKRVEVRDHFKKWKLLLDKEKEANVNSMNLLASSDLYPLLEGRSYSSFGRFNPKFYLTIKELIMCGQLVGYIFHFESVPEFLQKTSSKEKKSSSSAKLRTKRNSLIVNAIDKTFLPMIDSKFNLDLNEMKYTFTNKDTDNKRENIKKRAMNKLNLLNKHTIAQVESSFSESSNPSSSSSSYYSNEISQQHNEQSIKESKMQKVIEEEKMYHVNITRIKLYVYNYKKNTIEEKVTTELGSQVEYAINNKEELPYEKENRINRLYTKKGNTNPNQEMIDREKTKELEKKRSNELLLKQIDKALSKQESQPSIVRLGQISLLTIIIIFGIGVGFLLFFIFTFRNLLENLKIIQESLSIITNLIFGQFYVRELVLINHKGYTNNLNSREESAIKYKNYLVPIFDSTHSRLNYIITTFTPFRSSTLSKVTVNDIVITGLKDDYSVSDYQLSILPALLEINTALYHVIKLDINETIQTEHNVYYYMRNSINNAFFGVQELTSLFIDELNHNINNYKTIMEITFSMTVIVLLLCYAALAFAYNEVALRKESYLEVFFDIGKHTIELCLESCEFYNKKIQAESSNHSNDSSSSLSNEQMSIDDNYIDMLKNTSNNINEHKEINTKRSQRKAKMLSRQSSKTKLKVFFAFLLVIAYLLYVFISYVSYLSNVSTYINMLDNYVNLNIVTLYIYNFLKEFLFDQNQIVYNVPATKLINDILPNVYRNYEEKEEIVNSNINKFPKSFTDYYNQIYQNDICQLGEELYNDTFTCDDLMSGVAHFGLKSLTVAYIEDIRLLKNYYLLYNDYRMKYNFTYNLTLTGTKFEEEMKPKDESLLFLYDINHPIKIFNMWKFKELNMVLVYFIKPCYEELLERMKTELNNGLEDKNIFFIGMTGGYFLLNIVWFFGFFIPFVNRLNQIIYKTKNMLSIIPRQILCNIPNIGNVLGLSNKKKVLKTNKKESTNYIGSFEKESFLRMNS